MKKICSLVLALTMAVTTPSVLCAQSSTSNDYGTITNHSQTIVVNNIFNCYGIAVKGTTVSTEVTGTQRTQNGTTENSTTTNVVTTDSSWHAGSLKADQAKTNSNTNSSDKSTSNSAFTDTYGYTTNGNLQSVSGSGTTSSYDGDNKHTTNGTIDRDFTVQDGQGLLTQQDTSGTSKDKNGKSLGTFKQNTAIAASDYQYKGGSWVPMKQVSASSSNNNDGSSENVTRTINWSRDVNGTITGMNQAATGTQVQITGSDDGTKSKQKYTITDYSAPAAFDTAHGQGWYIQSEKITWTKCDKYDPWTKGTLIMVDGNLALKVDPADVAGTSFYKFDPTTKTGGTRKDSEGNYIFMLNVEDPQTQKELQANVGKEVNLMWQYFTKASASESGYAWLDLAPTSDSAVAYHLKNDKVASVEQWGGTWNQSKQYVILP